MLDSTPLAPVAAPAFTHDSPPSPFAPPPVSGARALPRAWIDAVERDDAPYLIDELVARRVFSEADARALFRELKRYFIVTCADPTRAYSIVSNRIDEVWHHFVLFTADYRAFCARHFRDPMDHVPSNAPPVPGTPRPVATYEEFARVYESLFGAPPPDAWRDDLAVDRATRVAVERDAYPQITLRTVGSKVELRKRAVADGQEPDEDDVLLRIDDWGAPALAFALREGTFFVREMPGVAEEDRVVLGRTLVRIGVLRVSR
jgi:hypothetical protein